MLNFATTIFAMAPGGGGGEAGDIISQFIPLVLIVFIFWFFVIRPQQRKAKAHRALISTLKKGDKVITDGGIHGNIQRVDDNIVTLEIAPKVHIKISRPRISDVVKGGKETPKKIKSDDKDEKEGN